MHFKGYTHTHTHTHEVREGIQVVTALFVENTTFFQLNHLVILAGGEKTGRKHIGFFTDAQSYHTDRHVYANVCTTQS